MRTGERGSIATSTNRSHPSGANLLSGIIESIEFNDKQNIGTGC